MEAVRPDCILELPNKEVTVEGEPEVDVLPRIVSSASRCQIRAGQYSKLLKILAKVDVPAGKIPLWIYEMDLIPEDIYSGLKSDSEDLLLYVHTNMWQNNIKSVPELAERMQELISKADEPDLISNYYAASTAGSTPYNIKMMIEVEEEYQKERERLKKKLEFDVPPPFTLTPAPPPKDRKGKGLAAKLEPEVPATPPEEKELKIKQPQKPQTEPKSKTTPVKKAKLMLDQVTDMFPVNPDFALQYLASLKGAQALAAPSAEPATPPKSVLKKSVVIAETPTKATGKTKVKKKIVKTKTPQAKTSRQKEEPESTESSSSQTSEGEEEEEGSSTPPSETTSEETEEEESEEKLRQAIPKYDGGRNLQKLLNFIDKVNVYLRSDAEATNKDIINIIELKFEGAAATWWPHLPPEEDAIVMRDKLSALKQTGLVSKYNDQFRLVAEQVIGRSFQEEKHAYLKGLNPDIARLVRANPQNLKTMQKLYSAATRIEGGHTPSKSLASKASTNASGLNIEGGQQKKVKGVE
ncbi:hypothetical protein HDU87_003039 [Geranomyces variabilis]|uniref:Uncharacterized protein n=1 Tax=Geranomyces variabilis TaxID=109894 RepID=A0AAD5TCZ6_9FUNG|nr:hypothetical protein HDU87_003039 [Geranomyces variabilis]